MNLAYAVGLVLLCPFLVWSDTGLVDPTRPIHHSVINTGEKSLNLSAILITNDRRQVVINGRQMSEGESESNFKVLKIRKNDVAVLQEGKRKILKLHRVMRKNVRDIAKDKGVDSEAHVKSEMVVR
ncbi:MAG: hypothetical protein K6L75_06545 [Cellvibrionaceae bacterium]